MSKELIKNIERLKWRFSPPSTGGPIKAFTPNSNDADALNEIIAWINREKEERINQNRYFGKMVSWAYLNLLRFHDGDKQAVQREIQEILEKDIRYHYELLRLQIDMHNTTEAFKFLGITDAFDCPKRDDGYRYLDDIRAKHAENKQAIKENQDILIAAMKPLEFQYVIDNMQHFITELLNHYGNLP